MSKPLSAFRAPAALDEVAGGRADPPMQLMLRRKAIRQFPNGQWVALYVNDALKLEVSIPYDKGKMSGIKAIGAVKEDTHDALYGEYLHHLEMGKHREADHIAGKVERNYGTDAAKHFRTAALSHYNGEMHNAAHHYAKFENSLREHQEMMLGENVIHKLRHIARSKQFGDVSFKTDGNSERVDPKDATKVLKLWRVASPQNRKHIERMINKGSGGIGKVSKFVDDHYKIPANKSKKKGK